MAKKKTKGGQGANGAQEAKAKAEASAPKKAKAQKTEAQAGLAGKIAQFREFLEESKIELKKVTFPTRKETMVTSTAVLVLVFVMALFLGLVDLGLSKIIEAILS